MRTVELLEQGLETARQIGFRVRHEWLGGVGGGACEFNGGKWLFVDLALSADDQLDQVCIALAHDPATFLTNMSPTLQRRLRSIPVTYFPLPTAPADAPQETT